MCAGTGGDILLPEWYSAKGNALKQVLQKFTIIHANLSSFFHYTYRDIVDS